MTAENDNFHFSIREVVIGDLQSIYNLICDLEDQKLDFTLFENTFRENLTDSNVIYYAALADKCIIGFVSLHIQHILHHSKPTGEVQELIISPGYQGHGVGSMLMHKVESVARELKLEEIELTTRVYREHSQVFYKQLGYVNTHFKFVKKMS